MVVSQYLRLCPAFCKFAVICVIHSRMLFVLVALTHWYDTTGLYEEWEKKKLVTEQKPWQKDTPAMPTCLLKWPVVWETEAGRH